MDIIGISEDNINDFIELLGEDLSEDVKRIYYNGIGVTDEDGQAAGAFVYELLNSESEDDTRSRICMVKSEDQEILGRLEEYYSNTSIQEDEIVESFYELAREGDARYLEEKGFSLEKKEDYTLKITLGELKDTAIGKPKKIPEYVTNIEALSVLQFRDTVKQILFKGHTGIMEDIPFLPKTWFDNSISACVSSDGAISGLFLIRRTPSGVLIPALLFAYGPDSKKDLLHMMRYSLQRAMEFYPPETVVKICRKSSSIKALTDNILPGKTGREIFFGERRER